MNATGKSKRIGEILTQMGCVSADEIAEALGVQSALHEPLKLGEILISRSVVERARVDEALDKQRATAI